MTDFAGITIHGYENLEYIGKGGHGSVYRAYNTAAGEFVAIKVVQHDERARENKLLERLKIEGEIIRDLRHPNIVPFVDFWEDERATWMVMKWLDGGDLREYISDYGAMATEQLIPLLVQVTSALDAAHAAQIVHRDIKPDNIMLDANGRAYLTDFGIAKRLGYQAITSMGVVVGSPHYLSPEQIMGYEISPRTDVYSLGITIYELLSGEHPFTGITSNMKMMMMLVQDALPDVTLVSTNLSPAVNDLIQRATAKDPAQRYPTASSVAWHLKEILGV